MAAFTQLQAEGYLTSRVGAGTRVSGRLPEDWLPGRAHGQRPAPIATRTPSAAGPPGADRPGRSPASAVRLARPFEPNEPALLEFPMTLWAQVASRRLRRASPGLLAGGDAQGYRPLRVAVADYLGTSRGVRCVPEQVIITTGVQQGLDLVARAFLRPGEAVWVEDPGYPGAMAAFRHAGLRLAPVSVDGEGLDVAAGKRLWPEARAVYVTPAHQFPLGATLSLERRLALLAWASEHGALILEDDYDSEFRFAGRPTPALQGLDRAGRSVVLLGSFNKALFPSLRLGYLVLPPAWVEPLAAYRFEVDRYTPTLNQAILADFITEGHFGRHLRRMRELYGERLQTLQDETARHLAGLLEIPPIQAGLNTAARLGPGLRALTSGQAQGAAAALEVEAIALDRFCLERPDPRGLLLGFAAFRPQEIREGIGRLASALQRAAERHAGSSKDAVNR